MATPEPVSTPTNQEEEQLARLEFKRRQEAALGRRGKKAAASRRVARFYGFLCPRCAGELLPVRYRGVEIDKCSRCDGVWLHCGELDRLGEGEGGFLSGMLRIFR